MGAEDKLVRNEKLIRDWNQGAATAIKNYYGHEPKAQKEELDFVCECSDLHCKYDISLSIKEYEKIHQRKDRFILAAGHENPKIEKVTEKNKNYVIVEKIRLES
ncbi:MAG TPA: hypothetical protein VLG47_02090 [Candidatus Saccharimonadales bacterium]|nr:hypothetical protein [Candidatus Saccharimonadales bacterium]